MTIKSMKWKELLATRMIRWWACVWDLEQVKFRLQEHLDKLVQPWYDRHVITENEDFIIVESINMTIPKPTLYREQEGILKVKSNSEYTFEYDWDIFHWTKITKDCLTEYWFRIEVASAWQVFEYHID